MIKYVPGDSVLGLEIGDRVSLTREQFERLSEAFLPRSSAGSSEPVDSRDRAAYGPRWSGGD